MSRRAPYRPGDRVHVLIPGPALAMYRPVTAIEPHDRRPGDWAVLVDVGGEHGTRTYTAGPSGTSDFIEPAAVTLHPLDGVPWGRTVRGDDGGRTDVPPVGTLHPPAEARRWRLVRPDGTQLADGASPALVFAAWGVRVAVYAWSMRLP